MSKEMTREEFLQRLSMLCVGAVGASTILTACGKKEEAETGAAEEAKVAADEPDPCADLTGLTDAEVEMRTTFEYVAKSPYPEKLCDNCQFWLEPEEGAFCGGCQIIKGPMHPKGYCKQWVIMQEQAS